MFLVKCDVHPWMSAYVGVFSHPFFAVTGDDGKFTIAGLPGHLRDRGLAREARHEDRDGDGRRQRNRDARLQVRPARREVAIRREQAA